MNAPAQDVVGWLVASGAQHDLVSWATQHADAWPQFWQQCPRGDWLLAVAARAGVPQEQLVDAAVACVPVLQPYLPDNEPMIENALALVRDRRSNAPTSAMVESTLRSLNGVLARCVDPAAHAAVMAVHALVESLKEPMAAVSVVVATVQAAVMDAGDCGMIEAARFTEHECARVVRNVIVLDAVAEALA